MKYFVIEIVEGDKKVAGKGMYEFSTYKEAMASFHSKLGVALKSDLYESERIAVLNESMQIEAFEVYEKEVPAVEAEHPEDVAV